MAAVFPRRRVAFPADAAFSPRGSRSLRCQAGKGLGYIGTPTQSDSRFGHPILKGDEVLPSHLPFPQKLPLFHFPLIDDGLLYAQQDIPFPVPTVSIVQLHDRMRRSCIGCFPHPLIFFYTLEQLPWNSCGQSSQKNSRSNLTTANPRWVLEILRNLLPDSLMRPVSVEIRNIPLGHTAQMQGTEDKDRSSSTPHYNHTHPRILRKAGAISSTIPSINTDELLPVLDIIPPIYTDKFFEISTLNFSLHEIRLHSISDVP
jgi:hypothetical protein